MTVHGRPTPIHPPILSFTDLSRWLDRRLEMVEEDLADDETAQAHGSRLRERRATLLDVAFAIREGIEDEQRTAVTDSSEAAWRERYPDADELTLRRLAGDR